MNGPTVYDVVADWFNGDTGPVDLIEALGLDTEMTFESLQRLVAHRYCSCGCHAPDNPVQP